MQLPRWAPAELLLAIASIGLFVVLAVRTWGDLFFLHGLAIAGLFLLLGYLLIVIMMRQYREQRAGKGADTDA